jgi:hypothetical protein
MMPARKFILPRSNDGANALSPMTKKPRRAAKQRPEGMSNADWVTDIQWQAVVNQDRRKREAASEYKEDDDPVVATAPAATAKGNNAARKEKGRQGRSSLTHSGR